MNPINPDDRRTPRDAERPESQPHGTTADQTNEMESEGGGATKEAPKPTTVPIPSGRVVK